jgi:uncharacterized membrane protein SirB2
MTYTLLLTTHVSLVLLSGAFFAVRGVWMLQESDLLQAKPVRILPHIIDTILLLSGFGLAYLISMYPITHDWLTTKLILLVAYIVLGIFALRRGKTKTVRTTALVLALGVYGYMLTVAFSKNSLGPFA